MMIIDDTRERQKPSKKLYSSVHALGFWNRLKTTFVSHSSIGSLGAVAWEIYATATGTAAQP